MPDRIRSLQPRAAGVSLAPADSVVACARGAATPVGHAWEGVGDELTNDARRAPARGGLSLSGAEHGASGAPTTRGPQVLIGNLHDLHSGASHACNGQSPVSGESTDGEGALRWAGTAIVMALILAAALLCGCGRPLHANPERFLVERVDHASPTFYLLTDKQTGVQYLVQYGGAIVQLAAPATGEAK